MPIDYVVKVHLLPQDTRDAEFMEALAVARAGLESVVYSADDAKRLVADGLTGSKVIVWEPSRWTQGDIIAWLGVTCEIRKFTGPETWNLYPNYEGFRWHNAIVVQKMNTSQPEADEARGWPG